MTEQKPRSISCPTCRKDTVWAADNPHRPFCSDRCRLIDLGEWASGGHSIPGQPVDDDLMTGDLGGDLPHDGGHEGGGDYSR